MSRGYLSRLETSDVSADTSVDVLVFDVDDD